MAFDGRETTEVLVQGFEDGYYFFENYKAFFAIYCKDLFHFIGDLEKIKRVSNNFCDKKC